MPSDLLHLPDVLALVMVHEHFGVDCCVAFDGILQERQQIRPNKRRCLNSRCVTFEFMLGIEKGQLVGPDDHNVGVKVSELLESVILMDRIDCPVDHLIL